MEEWRLSGPCREADRPASRNVAIGGLGLGLGCACWNRVTFDHTAFDRRPSVISKLNGGYPLRRSDPSWVATCALLSGFAQARERAVYDSAGAFIDGLGAVDGRQPHLQLARG